MKKRRLYFLGLLLILGVIFFVACFSIIYAVLNKDLVEEKQNIEHTLGFVYLFIHLIIVAVLFYLSFKAYLNGSAFIKVIMTNEREELNKKAIIRCAIIGGIFLIIGVYFVVLLCGVNSFLSFFALGVKLALANACLTVAVIASYLCFYRPKKVEEKAE